LLLAIALVLACHDSPSAPSTPSSLQVVSGAGQSGVPGYLLANPISVRLVDEQGNPVAGDTVVFTVADTTGIVGSWAANISGPFSVDRVATDARGFAQTTWRLGESLGAQVLNARVLRLPNLPATTVSATVSSSLATSVDGSASGMCAIDGGGRLGCWLPPRTDGGVVSTRFVPVSAPVQFTQVVVSSYGLTLPQGCALAATGHPWCFSLDAQANVNGLAELAGNYPALTTIAGEGDGSSGVAGLVGFAETSGSVFLLSSTAQLLATGPSAPPFPGPGLDASRDFVTSHSFHFLCGTSRDGRGTLCQRMFIGDLGPFDLPQVVGVPLP
jgi:hypothetical protein